ncbi:MAG: hypothetical protein ACF8Q5_14135, partial [Phycisphaerales bacterium JB040]
LSVCAGVSPAQGEAKGLERPSGEAAAQPESVGGLEVLTEEEIAAQEARAQEQAAKQRGYITDPLWMGRLSEAALLQILEKETRKMKQSPPTPEELVLTETQSVKVEEAFRNFREAVRKHNNEIREDIVALRKQSGLDERETDSLEEDEDFSPMLYINPDLMEPTGGEHKVHVDYLTVEQHEAREAMRALILSGPVVEDLRLIVLGVLTDEQGEALLERYDAVVEERLESQRVRERVQRTGRLRLEDLNENTQKKLLEMEPRQREAALNRIRMEMIAGGALKMKKHRAKFREMIQQQFKEREERQRQKDAEPAGVGEES